MSSYHMHKNSMVSPTSRSLMSGCGYETDSLTDAELLKFVNELKEEIRMLKLENEILEKTIMRLDPALMHGIYSALEYATKRNSSTSLMGSFSKNTTSKFGLLDPTFCSSRLFNSPSRASTRKSSSKIGGTVIYGTGPKINLLEMLELVSVEMDIQKVTLEKVKMTAAKQHAYLKAQLEEIDTRVSDTEKETKKFHQDVLVDGWDEIAQRIPAETWTRFMAEWTKRTDRQIGKLRLRTSTLNTQYSKYKGQIKLKFELSEHLRPVDFEKLKIENSECKKLIENKTKQIETLKKLAGDANLNLVVHKKAMMEQNNYLNKVLATKKLKEQQTVELDKESDSIQIQADMLSQQLDEIRNVRIAYEVPDVMEYVKVKWILTGLKHTIKVLENRAQIQRIALTTVNKKLQTLVSEELKKIKALT